MSLRILIIGRGEFPEVRTENNHILVFKGFAYYTTKDGSETFWELDDYNFAFLHLSPANPGGGPRAIEEWQKRWPGKVIGMGAGERTPTEFVGYTLPYIKAISSQELETKAWRLVPPGFLGSAADLVALLDRGQKEITLSALCILCQGYIAAHAERVGNRWGPPEVENALSEMGWNDEVAKVCAESLKDKRHLVEWATWWRPIFEPREKTSIIENIGEELSAKDFNSNPLYKPIVALIEEIYGGARIELATVAQAYNCLARELK